MIDQDLVRLRQGADGSVGFIGTGAITEAMVRGILAKPSFATEVFVSPRSADTAGRLANEFPEVEIAADNQDVVERSDTVFLAIRPQIAEAVIRDLRFRSGQCVVSVVAATGRDRLLEWIDGDVHLIQAIPLPFVAERQGVTAVYPPDNQIARLFDVLGTAIQCTSQAEYDMLAVASAMMSTYFGFMDFTSGWLAQNGLERSKGDAYVASLFASLAHRAVNSNGRPFGHLSEEFATKGGLNEQVLRDFERNGGPQALTDALDSVLKRVIGNHPDEPT